MDARPVRLALLCAVLALSALAHFHPHWSPTSAHQRFPVHLDEYWHWGLALDIQRSGDAEPQAGKDAELAASIAIHERGFQAYLAALQSVTGIPWVALLQYLPVAVALWLTLAAFAFAERWGAGVEAALWVAAIPTSLRFLGPAFAVPIAFALPLVILGFHALVHGRGGGAATAAMIILGALWPVHAMGALLLTVLHILYTLGRARSSPEMTTSGMLVLVPTILAWPYYARYIGNPFASNELPISLETLRLTGPLPLVFAAAGAAWLASRSDKRSRSVAAALGLALLGLLAVLVTRANWGNDLFRLYDRAVLTSALLAALLAGFGTRAALASVASAWPRRPPVVAAAIVAAMLLVQGAVAAGTIARVAEQPYYRPLDEPTYARYRAAAAHLDPDRDLAIVDGRFTLAWADVTGVATYHVQHPGAGAAPPAVQRFFEQGSTDTRFLVEQGITVVVTDRAVSNPDLVALEPGVYALHPRYAERIR